VQIEKAKTEYFKALNEIETFMVKEKTIDIEEEIKLAISKMGDLMEEKEDNLIDLAEIRAKIKTLKEQRKSESLANVSTSAIKENPHIESLKNALSLYEFQLAGLLDNSGVTLNSSTNETLQIEALKKNLTNFKTDLAEMENEKNADHPDVKNLVTKLKTTEVELNKEIENYKKALKKKIFTVKAQLKRELGNYQRSSPEMQSLHRELAALEVHLVGVESDIKTYTAILYTLPGKATVQIQLKTRLTASQQLYSSLLEYLSEVGVAEAMTLSEIRLVEPATVPDIDNPKSPQKILIIIASLFLGTIFGLGLAFLFDYIDDSIKTLDDVDDLGITLLGVIQKIKEKESRFVHQRDPKDQISESYRTIRNNLRFAFFHKPLKSLVVTSGMPEEGKTTNSINLSIMFARHRKNVLLVDADLRKPSVHRVLDLPNGKGLTSLLAGDITIQQSLHHIDIPGLNIITSGPVPPDPGNMIESEKMEKLINEAVDNFDMVILDCPPVLVVNDAVVLSKLVDANVWIAESKATTKRNIQKMAQIFHQVKISPAGLIVNKYQEKRDGYYSYYYQ